MKLQYIYLSVGILTLALNILLTLHIMGRHEIRTGEEIPNCDDIITFRLRKENSTENDTTAAVQYDDTVVQ